MSTALDEVRAELAQLAAADRTAKDRRYRDKRRAAGVQDKRGNRRPAAAARPFVGVDGEGGEVIRQGRRWVDAPAGTNHHHYLLLRAGDDVLMNADRSPLSTYQCLEFLADLPGDRCHVGFFFDYDVTMILRDLSRQELTRLMRRELRTWTGRDGRTFTDPIRWNGFDIEYLPRKEFKVRRSGTARYTVINDVGTFFQCSFLNALRAWKIGTDDDYRTIAEGKSGRVNFGVLTDETIRYNGREIVLLEELMTEFRRAAVEAGIVPTKWQGPGYMADALFKINNMIVSDDVRAVIPPALLDAANASYYGGRFEITAVGQIPGPVYQHDINSAYPYAETLLPCLEHGTWTRLDADQLATGGELDRQADDVLYLAHGAYTARERVNLYGLPYRNQTGNISWRGSGSGWYWSHEIRAAVFQDFTPDDVWLYEAHCHCQPFAFIRDVYDSRSLLGKSSKGLTIKLAMNSTYGKTCQSIGSPKYANPIYASLITSLTRAQLYTKCVRFGLDTVVMLATDGIFTTSEVDKDHSPKEERVRPDGTTYDYKPLGDWEVTTYDDGIFIVQPGLYFLPGDNKPKTRGIPVSKAIENRDRFMSNFGTLLDQLRRTPVPPWVKLLPGIPSLFEKTAVPITLRAFIGAKIGVHIGSEQIGEWVETTRAISFDWTTKRGRYLVHGGHLTMEPFEVGGETTPYSKDIGRMFNDARLTSMLEISPDDPDQWPGGTENGEQD